VEAQLFTLISDLVNGGIIADSTLLLIIISLIGLGYHYVLKPILEYVKNAPSTAKVEAVVAKSTDDCKNDIDVVSQKLDKLLEVLDDIEGIDKDSRRDVKELKRDVEQIKQILNQFQGHLMYGGGPSHFGNRELK
jgi:hypothetical protein